MNMQIPLQGGAVNSHQVFTAQLGENLIEFDLNYVQTGQWVVNLKREGITLAEGIMLEPNADIIGLYDLGIGSLVFIGADTTLDNLGLENQLIWVPPE